MKRTLAIVLAAAVVGALAGGVIGLMLAGGAPRRARRHGRTRRRRSWRGLRP